MSIFDESSLVAWLFGYVAQVGRPMVGVSQRSAHSSESDNNVSSTEMKMRLIAEQSGVIQKRSPHPLDSNLRIKLMRQELGS